MSDPNKLDSTLITSIFEEAWETLWKDAFLYLIAGLLSALLVGISLGVLGGVVWVGFALLIERRKQGHDVGPVAMFSGFGHFIPATLAFAILVVGVSVGLVLLVLPGLFLFAAWSLTFCAMARENLSAGAALARSYGIFRDHTLIVVVLLILLGILNTIAGALVFAQLISVPFSLIALSVTYDKLAYDNLGAESAAKNNSRHADGMSPHRVG